MKNKNQHAEWKITPDSLNPTILAWGSFENFISGDDKTEPPKERCPIKSI